jgi:hypothetical protein
MSSALWCVVNGRAVAPPYSACSTGRLDLEVAEPVEERPHGADHARPRDEAPPHLRVHGEVRVALPVPLLRVAEARVPDDLAVDHLLLPERQRAQRLGQELRALHAHRRLPGPGPEQRPLHPDHVPDVHQRLQQLPRVVAEGVAAEVQLHAPVAVGEVRERGLPLRPPRREPPGDPHHGALRLGRRYVVGPGRRRGPRLRLERLERGDRRRGRVRALVRVGERGHAARLERRELVAARPQHVVERLAVRVRRRRRPLAGGAQPPCPAPVGVPCCFR